MPIKVACQCGQSFAAPDNLAGKNVKCPKCGSPLTIPRPQGAPAPRPNPAAGNRPAGPAAPQAPGGGLSSLLDEAGITAHAGQRCLKCNKPLSPATSICIHCGFNSATGEKIHSSVASGPHADGHGGAAGMLLSKAAEELKKAPAPKADAGGSALASYVLTLVAFVVAGAVMYGAWSGFQAIEHSGNSYYWAGVVMVTLGLIFIIVSYIVIAVVCFKEGATHGVLAMATFFYGWYLAVIKAQGFWVTLALIGIVFALAGWGMIAFLGEEEKKPGAMHLETIEIQQMLA